MDIKLVMLLFAKGLDSEEVQSFHLGSYVDEASEFDDLVFVYSDKEGKSKVVLLQAKHRDNPEKKIKLDDIFKKCLNCYVDIKTMFSQPDHVLNNMADIVEFVFFTNASIEESHQHLIRHKFLNFFPNNTYTIKTIPINAMEDMKIPFNFIVLVDALIEDYSTQKLQISREIYQKYSCFLNEHVWQIKDENFSYRHNFLDGSSSHESAVDLSNAFLQKLAKIRQMDENSIKKELKQLTLRITRKPNSKESQESKRVPVTKITSEDMNEFFGRFYLFVNQPSEVALEKLTKDIIKNRFSLTDTECSMVYNYVRDKILSWWINVNRCREIDYLTEKNDFFEEGKNLLSWLKAASSLNETLSMSKIDKFCLQFKKDYNIESRVVGIVIINDDERVLHLARLRQTLNSKYGSGPYYYYTVNEKMNCCVIESFRTSFDLLILDLHGSSEISVAQRTELEQSIKLNPDKKVILFGEPSALKKFGIKIDTWNDDSVSFEHLELKTQEKILNEMEIRFQGQPTTLIDIFPNHCHLIDSSTLARMMDPDECYSIGPKYDLNMDDMIERNLNSIEVDDDCFCDDRLTFAVSNISYEELEKLRKKAGRCVEDIRQLKDDDDFDSIQIQDDCSLHHLKKTGSIIRPRYSWVKSISRLDHIRPYVYKGFDRMDPMEVTSKIVLVVAEPGMGKTTLLSMMASSRKNATWNIVIYLNDHSTRFKEWKDRSLDINQVLDFLGAALELDLFGKALLSYHINVYGEINIFLDGFDEICPSHGDVVVNLVKALEMSKVNKIWVSSRSYMTEELENKLGVFAHSIWPFTDDDQKTFLKQYWKKFLRLNEEESKIEEYAANLLRYFSKVVNDKIFLGNPLQLRMLAEYYKENVIQLIHEGDSPIGESTFKLVSMFDLYDKIIRTKYFDVWKKEKLASREIVTEMEEEQSAHEYENFEEDHKYLACFTILDDDRLKKLLSPMQMKKTKEKIEGIKKGKEKRGVINNIIDGKPVFVHRTYAEFFLSKMLTDLLEVDFEAIRMFLLNSGFFKHRHTMIRTFFDHSLSTNKPLFKAALTNNAQFINAIEDPQNLNERDALGRSPLYLASFYDNTEAVKAILDKFDGNISNKDPFDKWTPITVATNQGYWGIMEALLLHGADLRQIKNITQSIEFLVHQGDIRMVKKIIETNKVDDFKYFFQKQGKSRRIELARYLFSQWENPFKILEYYSYIENKTFLIELLSFIKNGDLEMFKEFIASCLFFAIDDEEDETVQMILKLGVDRETKSDSGWTNLHWAAFCGVPELVTRLLGCGADQNATDYNNMTPLDVALENGNWELIRLLTEDEGFQLYGMVDAGYFEATKELLERRPELIDRKFRDDTTLLHVAVLKGHTKIVKYLLEKNAKAVVYDSRNMSPLHLVFDRNWRDIEWSRQDMVELLERHGAKVTDCNSSGWMVLHTIVQYDNVDIMQRYLVSIPGREQWINQRDSNGSTLLHEASMSMVELLLEYEADDRVLDNLGCGPIFRYLMNDYSERGRVPLGTSNSRHPVSELHFAVAIGHIRAVRWLIEDVRVDVDLGRGQYATPLHFAVALDQLDIRNYLIEKGADRRALEEVSTDSRELLLEFRKEKIDSKRGMRSFESFKRMLLSLDRFSMIFSNVTSQSSQ